MMSNNHTRYLLMLEDEQERIDRFLDAIVSIDPSLELVVWRSALDMIRESASYFNSTVLISLDHDLYPLDGEVDDLGDGVEVAKFLASNKPICPVIVHSSNADRAPWMIGEFELAGWTYKRVLPIGSDWIEHNWTLAARKLLRLNKDHID